MFDAPILLIGVGLAALGLTGCSRLKTDLDHLCHADQRSGAAAIADLEARRTTTAQWLESTLKTFEGREASEAVARASPEQRGALLRHAAQKYGYDEPCPFADVLERWFEEAVERDGRNVAIEDPGPP